MSFIKEVPIAVPKTYGEFNVKELTGVMYHCAILTFGITEEEVEKIISLVGSRDNVTINGSFEGNKYIMPRYISRIDREVPSISDYITFQQALFQELKKVDSTCELTFEPEKKTYPEYIMDCGCDEGYVQGRLKQVISLYEFDKIGSETELIQKLKDFIGTTIVGQSDLENSQLTLEEMIAHIKLFTKTITHTAEEARSILGSNFTVIDGRIAAYSAIYKSMYVENKLRIICDETPENYYQLIRLLHLWKQARATIITKSKFSIVNVETDESKFLSAK